MINYHFGGKRKLYVAIVDRTFARSWRGWSACRLAAPAPGAPRARRGGRGRHAPGSALLAR